MFFRGKVLLFIADRFESPHTPQTPVRSVVAATEFAIVPTPTTIRVVRVYRERSQTVCLRFLAKTFVFPRHISLFTRDVFNLSPPCPVSSTAVFRSYSRAEHFSAEIRFSLGGNKINGSLQTPR